MCIYNLNLTIESELQIEKNVNESDLGIYEGAEPQTQFF